MTARELTANIGKTGTYVTGGFILSIVVDDVRRVFNRTDYLIRPTDGAVGLSGFQWVSSDAVVLF